MIDSRSLLPSLDASSRIWVYVSNNRLTDDIVDDLNRVVSTFGESWSSHGRKVHSGFSILENQVLVLGANVDQGQISGCGIDKSLHLIEGFAEANGFEWCGALSVVYRRDDGMLDVVSRGEFRDRVKNGIVSGSTIVLDSSVSTLSALRNGHFELAASDSWHATVFKIPASVST